MRGRWLRAGLIAGGLLLCAATAAAQPVRPFALAYVGIDHFFAASVQDLDPSIIAAGDVTATLTRWTAGITIPIQLRPDRTTILTGLAAEVLRTSFDGLPDQVDGEDTADTVTALTFYLGLRQRLGARWWITAATNVGANSDFERLSGDDAMISGLARIDWVGAPSFSMGGGVIQSTIFGELLLLPLVALEWDITNRTYLSILLPASIEAIHRLETGPEAGIRVAAVGNEFNLTDAPSGSERFRYALVNAGAVGRIPIRRPLWLHVSAGLNLSRRLESEIATQELRDQDFDAAPYVHASLVVRPR